MQPDKSPPDSQKSNGPGAVVIAGAATGAATSTGSLAPLAPYLPYLGPAVLVTAVVIGAGIVVMNKNAALQKARDENQRLNE